MLKIVDTKQTCGPADSFLHFVDSEGGAWASSVTLQEAHTHTHTHTYIKVHNRKIGWMTGPSCFVLLRGHLCLEGNAQFASVLSQM